jgi:hypothetical protein
MIIHALIVGSEMILKLETMGSFCVGYIQTQFVISQIYARHMKVKADEKE